MATPTPPKDSLVYRSQLYQKLRTRFSFLEQKCDDPVSLFDENYLESIWGLNDRGHWTRERIADWLTEKGY